jgi:hypothetical protein
MEFLKQIDFQHHDGVNLPMINDFMRNQFYDRILSRYVANQRCTDIGFGTGLLSIMALKHGARHVRAFESDQNRYLLGREIISQLKLQDRIELIHDQYSATKHTATAVTFTETVNGNLWWEGLWNSLPPQPGHIFLPGEYFLELWAVEVPDSFAQGLCRVGQTQKYFAPGIDIDPEFVAVVDVLAGREPAPDSPALPQGIVQFERQQETDWNWIPYMRAVQAGSVVASYHAKYHCDDQTEFVLDVQTDKWRNKTVLIVPRMGMQQDQDRLYLDTGHWGPGENPVLLINLQNTLVVKHNIKTGIITYSLGT